MSARGALGPVPSLLARRVLRPSGWTGAAPLLGPTLATADGAPCGATPGLVCSQVIVPLDREGQLPGTVTLHVETLPAPGLARGTVFLVAGGPGQGSARVFGLGSPENASFYRYLFPGYTLVAYDDRGTGDSGVLRCPELQTSVSVDPEPGLVAECAVSIGPQRDFYSTREHAEDLEAVRQALGVERIALWGTSYGTKLALAYALAHPDHVERLLLDSVVSPDTADPFRGQTLRAIPGALRGFCADGFCRPATRDLAGEVVALANRLASQPLSAKVLQPSGATRTWRATGLALLSVTVDADLSPGLALALPAAVHAANARDARALLRLVQLDVESAIVPDEELSAALFAATVCRDGPFPWTPETPVAQRPALVRAAVAALPAGSLGPFGTWAVDIGNASFCLQWPSPAGGAGLGQGPLPDVPVLAVSGGFDMRTPTVEAADVVSRFRQGTLLVVPGVGHSVLGADLSFCSQRAVHDWMLGGAPAASCPRPPSLVRLVPAYPSLRVGEEPTAAQTLALVRQTLLDAEALWATTSGGDVIAGLARGRLVAAERSFTLVRYSVTPGVELSGKLRVVGSGLPLRFSGAITVGGATAATGVLGVTANRVAGTLDGRLVRG